ncbi:hypothetical protein [Asaia bogorensis]|uniref:hypothetical protein n=1 Tax=Asaia bogorensis TaxID=91915 RepID=UPI00285C95CC|nr:hypothetical protein [Asaia bogorensis]MDR6183508.1 hypothetical protein [Asaia bogorensis NBRC 16594]
MKRVLSAFFCAILSLLVLTSHPRAQPDSCILGAFTLPILGGPGDAPVLPATMQGKPVALYYSTTVDGLYGGDIAAYGGRDTGTHTTIVQDGAQISDAPLMKTGELELGTLDLGTVSMVRLPQFPMRSVGLRPVIGVIGAHQFDGLAVLVDIPHSAFAFIRFSADKSCEGAAARFFGPGETHLPLDAEHRAQITLHGVRRSLALDPNAAFNTLPATWMTTPDMKKDRSVSGEWPAPPSPRDETITLPVIPEIAGTAFHLQGGAGSGSSGEGSGSVLGQVFFEHHVVLFDYPNHVVHFLPSRHQRSGEGSALRFPHTLRNEREDLMIRPPSGTWPLTPMYSGAGIQPGLN